jgi:hypothetical protein
VPGDERQNHFLSEEGERARRAHAALSHPYGDFHTLLHVYNTWVANGRSPQWCDRNYVNFRSIKTVSSIRYALFVSGIDRRLGGACGCRKSFHLLATAYILVSCVAVSCLPYGSCIPFMHAMHREHLARDAQKVLNSTSNASRKDSRPEERALEKRMCTAITTGFYMNSAVLCAHGSVFKHLSLLDLERQRNRQEALDVRMVHIHPTSSLAIEGAECPHTTLVYQALAHGNKLYMKQVCKADSKRLKQLQKDWVYVDPYVLCGRRQKEADAATAAPAVQQKGASTSTSSGGGASNSSTTSVTSSDSRLGSSAAAVAASSSQPSVGSKRPLSRDEEQPASQRAEGSAAAASAVSASVGAAAVPGAAGGANQAAEAAKQRYLERMAQQKNRKK